MFIAGNLNAFAILGGIIIAFAGIIIGLTIVFSLRRSISNRRQNDCDKVDNDKSINEEIINGNSNIFLF